ncbi:uncharacterized protein LOC121593902 isoform X2 [Anopheles merus]|uniref:uncharacterized protein LOC121593902 isoform X2 n=1 Tax=Anopheles merus TaxID=30066 RepID=UPI001BE48460|nr:uncharacterized protein LOC121593902 isoform X2 [Anopheles merus]
MLEHTAKDGPEDVPLKHAQSVCILSSDGPGLVSVKNHQENVSVIYQSCDYMNYALKNTMDWFVS